MGEFNCSTTIEMLKVDLQIIGDNIKTPIIGADLKIASK